MNARTPITGEHHCASPGRLGTVLQTLEQTLDARGAHEVLEAALRTLEASLSPTWCAIWLFDQESDTWYISHSRGLSGDAAELRFPRGSAIPCWVGERGETRRFDQLDHEQEFQRLHPVHDRMRSALYVPMEVRNRPVGVIALYSDQNAHFRKADEKYLELIASHLGYVVTAMGRFEERQKVAELDARDRLAQELHDVTLQTLSSLRLYAHGATSAIGEDDWDEAESLLGSISATVEEAIRETSSAIAALRSVVVTKSLETVMPRLRGRLEAAGLAVDVDGDLSDMPPAASDVLASVAREATNNILKHSNADHVRFSITRGHGCLILECVDDGVGTRPVEGDSEHLGFIFLAEQVDRWNGQLIHGGSKDGGFIVRCVLPEEREG